MTGLRSTFVKNLSCIDVSNVIQRKKSDEDNVSSGVEEEHVTFCYHDE